MWLFACSGERALAQLPHKRAHYCRSDRSGIGGFAARFCSRTSNPLVEYGSTQTGGDGEQHVVAAFDLDWLLTKLPQPDAIKIDAEGVELKVLRNQAYTQ
jgi:FkbM family methyltransferase